MTQNTSDDSFIRYFIINWSTIVRARRIRITVYSLRSQWHLCLTDSRPITSRRRWPITSTTGVVISSTVFTEIMWLWRRPVWTVLLRTTLAWTILWYNSRVQTIYDFTRYVFVIDGDLLIAEAWSSNNVLIQGQLLYFGLREWQTISYYVG